MKQFNRRLTAALIALLMLVSLLGIPVFAAEDDIVVIDIFHTNDIHARTDNYPYMASYINSVREENDNVLLFDAGDTLHGQTIATLMKGESIVKIMNAMGYNAMTPGNHDFNYGIDRLFELEEMMDFPVLTANVLKEDDELDSTYAFAPWTMFSIDDLNIAVIGASTPETTFKTHPNNIIGYEFVNPVEAVRRSVEVIEGGGIVDFIIVLCHLGIDESSEYKASDLETIEGIDLIIDGHSHSKLEAYNDDFPITSSGEYGALLGHVRLIFDADYITIEADSISIADLIEDGLEPDEEVAAIIAEVKDMQAPILAEVVGSTNVNLVGEREVVRTNVSNLGNLITAAMIWETGADIAFTNGGGIRASIKAGDITLGDVVTVLPFGNYIVTKNILGADIIAALELGLSAYPASLGGFPHFSGMKVVFNPGAAAGSRVVRVTVGGEPLDPEAEYAFATNDFMAAGGDGYTMFGDYPILNEYKGLDEALIDYLADGGAIPHSDDRLLVTAETTPSKVFVNGEQYAFDAYKIGGNNYFMLRDLALVFDGTDKGFEIDYDGDIYMISGEAYTPRGDELSPGIGARTALPTVSNVFFDGEAVNAAAYTIGGSNYFKLRDILKLLDVEVTYDGDIHVNTANPYDYDNE